MIDAKKQFKGVFGFPVTVFKKDLSLDLDGLASNVDEMSKHPFCATVAAGGTGEVYSMTVEESIEVVRTTVDAVAGRMPVVAGVGFNTAMATAVSLVTKCSTTLWTRGASACGLPVKRLMLRAT